MTWIKRYSKSTLIAVLLTLGLVIKGSAQVEPSLSISPLSNKLPNQWEAKFKPPSGRGNPDAREGGATRGPNCIPRDKKLIALVPPSGFGSTLTSNPTLYWFVPRTLARQAEFVLRDQNDRKIYTSKFIISGAPGIMSLQIPAFATLKPLEVGQEYTWDLALICNPADAAANITIGGSIQRIENRQLSGKIQQIPQTSLQDQIAFYADSGVWYETINKLFELRASNPNDPAVKAAWVKLLKSVGLETIAQEPPV